MNTVTAELLERLARTRRFSVQTLDIAKRLFLFNDPPRKLAAEYGVNLARIYAIRDSVSQAAQAQRVPPGWEEVTLIAPKALISEFRQRIAEAQVQQRAEVGFPKAAAAAIYPGIPAARNTMSPSQGRRTEKEEPDDGTADKRE